MREVPVNPVLTSWLYFSVWVLFEASVLVCDVPPFHELILLTFAVFLSSNRSCWAWASGRLSPLVAVPFTFSVACNVVWSDGVCFHVCCVSLDPFPSLSASHFRWEAHSPVYYTFHFDYTFEWRLWGQKNLCNIGPKVWLCNKIYKITFTRPYIILLKELCSLKRREILNKLVYFWKHISAEWFRTWDLFLSV